MSPGRGDWVVCGSIVQMALLYIECGGEAESISMVLSSVRDCLLPISGSLYFATRKM